jgi:hypothetical protein
MIIDGESVISPTMGVISQVPDYATAAPHSRQRIPQSRLKSGLRRAIASGSIRLALPSNQMNDVNVDLADPFGPAITVNVGIYVSGVEISCRIRR